MALPSVVQILRPRTFFHFISLLTATEFITVSLLINKIEGVYGILALFTGFHLSALQLSMYVYSIIVFALVCYLGPHIRKQSPLQNLALAWIYILDTIINAVYTILFGLGWFIVLAQHLKPATSENGEGPLTTTPGQKTINETSGFTAPEAGQVDRVEVVAEPRPDKFPPGQDATAYPIKDGSGLGNVVFQSGSIASISVISLLWFIRLYFVLIIMAHARQVLRGYIQSAPGLAASKTESSLDLTVLPAPLDTNSGPLPNPFHHLSPLGQGWRGKLGRLMTRFPAVYWLGRDEADEEWVRGADERFRTRSTGGTILRNPPAPSKGTRERERRARSGTGPPTASIELLGRRSGESSAFDARPSGEY